MTAVNWLINEYFGGIDNCTPDFKYFVNQAIEIEKQQIHDAMMHALDEDGHTGDWKIIFINKYYNSIKEK